MRVTGGWAGAIRSYLGNGAVARSLDQLRIKQRPLRASVAAARNGVFLPRPARSIDDGYGLRSGREWLHGLDGCIRCGRRRTGQAIVARMLFAIRVAVSGCLGTRRRLGGDDGRGFSAERVA